MCSYWTGNEITRGSTPSDLTGEGYGTSSHPSSEEEFSTSLKIAERQKPKY